MPRALLSILLLIFLATGGLVVILDADPESVVASATCQYRSLIFGMHMACWMVFGMMANYLWDLFKSQKSFADINLPDLLLPLLVPPIVYYSIWSLWPEERNISFAYNLIAFQNGFFWQVILSKAGPITPGKGRPLTQQPND